MKKQALSLAACIAAGYPGLSSAIGLGDIKSTSHLNQPLNARIELLSTTPKEAKQISVRLAPAEVFNRIGIERPAYLNSLRFSASMQNGKPVILVSSTQAINEPFVNFLLEVSWPQGQLLKEYTILLDPPVLVQGGNIAGNAATVRAEPKGTGVVNRTPQNAPAINNKPAYDLAGKMPPPVGSSSVVANNRAQQARQTSPATTTYRVRSGDTLSRIATRTKPRGVTSDQMMLALFRANPDAFRRNNINYLNAGAVLNVPSLGDAQRTNSAEAKRVVLKHYAEWKKFRSNVAGKTIPQKQANKTSTPPAKQASSTAQKTPPTQNNRLEVMGSKSSAQVATAGAGDSKVSAAAQANLANLRKQLAVAREALVTKKRENTELKSRVTELESLLNKKNRLIELKNQQLAKAQNNLKTAQNASTPPPSTPPKTTEGNGVSQPPAASTSSLNRATTNSNQNPAVSPLAQAQGTAGNAQPPAANQVANQVANQANTNAGQINRAVQEPPVGNEAEQEMALSPAQLAQKRREAMEQEASENADPFKPEKENSLLDFLASPIVAAAGAGSILLLLLGWLLLSRRKPEQDKAAKDVALDDESFDKIDAGLAEKDDFSFDDDQFNDSAQKAFEDELKSADLDKPKHASSSNTSNTAELDEEDDILQEADVYIVYGLHDQAETELKKAIKDRPEKLEYRHKLLENYLASNNKDAFDQQAEAFLKVDGANKDALWKKIVEMGRKISPDNTLYQAEGVASSSDKPSENGGLGIAAAAVGGAAVAAATSAVASSNKESETVEPTIDDDIDLLAMEDDLNVDALLESESNDSQAIDTPPALIDATDSEKNTSSVQTPSEPSIDDISLNFDDLEDDLGDMDFDGFDDSFSLDDLEKELDQGVSTRDKGSTKPEEAALFDEATDQDNIIMDFDNILPDSELQQDVVNSEPQFESDDLELANLSLEVGSNDGIGKILPEDTPYTSNAEADSALDDNVLSFLDLSEDEFDLQDAHISTKLDLARAYLDMGDIEGARSTLEEVMVEGSDAQKQEAEQLLHQTG